jgi:hypothetical protein
LPGPRGPLRGVGRNLQLAGLVFPLAAIFLQLMGALSLGQMLMAALTSIIAFYLGRMIEDYA